VYVIFFLTQKRRKGFRLFLRISAFVCRERKEEKKEEGRRWPNYLSTQKSPRGSFRDNNAYSPSKDFRVRGKKREEGLDSFMLVESKGGEQPDI